MSDGPFYAGFEPGELAVPMGARRFAAEIDAPLAPRLKVRLQRAITATLLNPTRGAPTLRRTALVVTTQLHACGFSDERIRALFAKLIEEVAYLRSLHGTSIVSGQPRWTEVLGRVYEWTDLQSSDHAPHP